MVGSKFNAAAGVPHGLIEAILGTASDAIIATDADGRITFWNPGATRIFGFTSEEAVGSSLDLIIPENLRATSLGGIHSGNGNRRKPLRPRRPFVGAGIDQGRTAHFCRIHDRLVARPGKKAGWDGSHPPGYDKAL